MVLVDTMHKLIMGVTGHRRLNNVNILNDLLQKELRILADQYTLVSIISPLADGSDRIVANILLDVYQCKLITPLPFAKKEYEKDFSNESKIEFIHLLSKSFHIYEVSSLEENSREECYFKVGQEVTDRCDVLVSLWDGKASKGLGGTGDIVAYAKKIGKPILHIDTKMFKVYQINFENLNKVSIGPNNPNQDS